MNLSILDKAMAAFVANGGDRSFMDVLVWAETFHVEPDQVRKSWERHMTVPSRKPCNSYDVEGK